MSPTLTHRPRTVETDAMRLRILELVVERCEIGASSRDVFDQVAGIVDLPTSEVTAVANMNGWPNRTRLTSNRDTLTDRLRPTTPPANPAPPRDADQEDDEDALDGGLLPDEDDDLESASEAMLPADRPNIPAGSVESWTAAGFAAGLIPLRNIDAHPSNIGRNLGDLRDLARSIRADGIRVPVVLERHRGRYRLRDGHRRIAAAKLAGLARVPAIIHAAALDEREWLLEAIDYNLRRQGYSDEDKRRVAHQLVDLGVTRAGVATAFAITAAKVAELLDGPTVKPDRPKQPSSTVGRRLVLHAVQDWRTRAADADTILRELEALLAPQEAGA